MNRKDFLGSLLGLVLGGKALEGLEKVELPKRVETSGYIQTVDPSTTAVETWTTSGTSNSLGFNITQMYEDDLYTQWTHTGSSLTS